MASFDYDRLTQFSESDAAGIIHFSKIACYVEEAEHAFLESAGFPVEIHNPKALRWPRVFYKAEYGLPILPLQKITVQINSIYVGRSSVNWKWYILSENKKSTLCEGEMKTVCCILRDGKIEVCPLPDDLRSVLFSS